MTGPRRTGWTCGPTYAAVEYQQVWDRAAELRDVLPLLDLSESQRSNLVGHMRVRELRPKDVLYEQGDRADQIFVVHTGAVKVFVVDNKAREVILALLGRGDFLGTLSLFETQTRDSSVAALVPSVVLQIARSDALGVLEANPRAMNFMIRRFAVTIAAREEKIKERALLDVQARVARLVLELDRSGLDLTQTEMAAYVGSSREHVNRVLAEFSRRQLITVQATHVKIEDHAALQGEVSAGPARLST